MNSVYFPIFTKQFHLSIILTQSGILLSYYRVMANSILSQQNQHYLYVSHKNSCQKSCFVIENFATEISFFMEKKEHHMSAVDWRKVLLVLFMIFELGPYLESLWNGLPSEPIRCGVKEFFHPKNWLWSVWHKKREKSLWCLNFGLGEKS